jgi:hypothetical protein
MKLYEIPALRRIEEQIADAEGEITPDIDAQLSALEGELERKLEWIALMAREAQAEGDVYGAEIVRLAARKKAAENRAASLKAYAMEVMQQTGREKGQGRARQLGGGPKLCALFDGDGRPGAPPRALQAGDRRASPPGDPGRRESWRDRRRRRDRAGLPRQDPIKKYPPERGRESRPGGQAGRRGGKLPSLPECTPNGTARVAVKEEG